MNPAKTDQTTQLEFGTFSHKMAKLIALLNIIDIYVPVKIDSQCRKFDFFEFAFYVHVYENNSFFSTFCEPIKLILRQARVSESFLTDRRHLMVHPTNRLFNQQPKFIHPDQFRRPIASLLGTGTGEKLWLSNKLTKY
jgi:hypothetical protein